MLHFLGLILPYGSTSVTVQGSLSPPPIPPQEERRDVPDYRICEKEPTLQLSSCSTLPWLESRCILVALSSLREGCNSASCAVTERDSIWFRSKVALVSDLKPWFLLAVPDNILIFICLLPNCFQTQTRKVLLCCPLKLQEYLLGISSWEKYWTT